MYKKMIADVDETGLSGMMKWMDRVFRNLGCRRRCILGCNVWAHTQCDVFHLL
jgi:hypothetical protein